MNKHLGLYILTGLNLVLLGCSLVQQGQPAHASGPDPESGMLRGRGLQIVDSQGRVRASISVLPATRSANGEEQAETVLLRLITEQGRPTVKIAASEPSSGLNFTGPTGTQDTYLKLQSTGSRSQLVLRNEGGREQVLQP